MMKGILYLALLICWAGLSGCEEKKVITPEKKLVLEEGMSEAQIYQALGEPPLCRQKRNEKNCIWGDKYESIKIQFIDGVAVTINETHTN